MIDVAELQDQVYVVSTQPYGDLYDFLKQHRKLEEGLAAKLFRQIVVLVQDAHRKNVVIRDLQLRSFVFEDDDKSVLRLHILDHARLVEGTELLTDDSPCPAFSCPEMLQEGSYSGRAADLWSLGILFYALLVGHYPFYDTDIQLLNRNIQRGYYMPQNISGLAKSMLRSLLVHDPKRRVPAEALLKHPWFVHNLT